MAGLGLGSWLAGRGLPRLVRPLRVYGLLEIATGIAALGLPWLLPGIVPGLQSLGIGDGSALTLGVVRFVAVVGLLAAPTACLGATFPVMIAAVRRAAGGSGGGADQVGRLYAANLAGGVLGTLGAGFGLLPAVGLGWTNALAAAVSLSIGAAALLLDLDRRLETPAAEGPVSAPPPAATAASMPLVIAGLAAAGSGVLAMVYEVAWSRALALVLGSSVYAFTIVLATVLVGLAIGSRLASCRPRRLSAGLALGLAQMIVGLGALAGHAAMILLPSAFVALFRLSGGAPGRLYPLEFLLAAVVVLVPAVGLGATLPLCIELGATVAGSIERATARLYAANAAGAAVGGFAGGFLLLPAFGLRGTVLRAALIGVTAGGLLLVVFGRERRVAHTVALLGPLAGLTLALAMPSWDLRVMTSGVAIGAPTLAQVPRALLGDVLRSEQIVFYEEGLTTTVSVGLRDGILSLRVNGKPDASTAASDMTTQLLLAHLPLLVHPDPRETLVIGLGSGVTAGAALRHPVARLTIADLEPAVLRASRFFDEVSGAPLADPRVRLTIADVRSQLRLSRDRYDVAISEPSNPWMTVAASLFTRDFFQLVKDRLRPGGVFAQWVQLYRLSPDLLRSLVATYTSVFPHVAGFRTGAADLVLVGSAEPLAIDYPTLAGRMARAPVAASLARVGVTDVGDLLARLVLDAEDAARFGAGARLNTEDNALVEFAAPRSLYLDSAPANLAALARARVAGGTLQRRLLDTAPEGIRAGLARRLPGPPRP